jgi:hypothetical protein
MLIDVVVRELGPGILETGAYLYLTADQIRREWVFPDIEPEIHVKAAISTRVWCFYLILNFEPLGVSTEVFLKEFGESVHVLDIVADHTRTDEISTSL